MDRNVLITILIVVLIIFYVGKMFENYESCSYDITPSITTNMDWNGAILSKYPYYSNNLVNPPAEQLKNINQLQKYNSELDGPTNTMYVSDGMNVTRNINDPNNREGFTMMNPFVPH